MVVLSHIWYPLKVRRFKNSALYPGCPGTVRLDPSLIKQRECRFASGVGLSYLTAALHLARATAGYDDGQI
jgi:hypothetical protein